MIFIAPRIRPPLFGCLKKSNAYFEHLQSPTPSIETVEKQASERLMENVQLQGFRNPEE
jgi:hypothetical protein